jgi:hypothetical protein
MTTTMSIFPTPTDRQKSQKVAVIGITRWFWPKFVPIARRLRGVSMPTLCATVSRNRLGC